MSERRRSAPEFLRRVREAVLVAGLLTACSDGAAEREAELVDLRARREQLVLQFMRVQEPIRRVQAAALDSDSVSALQERFYRLLRQRMIALDPESEALLDRARELGRELERVSGPILLAPGETAPTAEEKTAVVRELSETEEALRPLEDQAMADSAVGAAFRALQDGLKAEMIRRDTTVEGVLDRLRAIQSEIVRLDRQIADLEG